MKKILLMISILMFVKWVQAQDPNFSQFFSSPLNVNPGVDSKDQFGLACDFKFS